MQIIIEILCIIVQMDLNDIQTFQVLVYVEYGLIAQ